MSRFSIPPTINFQSLPAEPPSAGDLIHWLTSCHQLDEAALADTAAQLTGLAEGQLRDLFSAAIAADSGQLPSFSCVMLPLSHRPRLLAFRLRLWPDLDDSTEDAWHAADSDRVECDAEDKKQSLGGSASAEACANPSHYTRRSWCTVFYYELDNRVGDPFRAIEPCLRVDGGGGGGGFFDRHGRRRFCLAPLWNADRPPAAFQVRRFIGQGVSLQMCRGGTVLLHCRSPLPVFVQSPNASLQRGWHPATVCRVPPGGSLCIFSDDLFLRYLADCRHFEEAYSLIRMCHIRVSFAKGWGSDYRRQRITASPCWLEIVLARPLIWLDRVLVTMGGPANLNLTLESQIPS